MARVLWREWDWMPRVPAAAKMAEAMMVLLRMPGTHSGAKWSIVVHCLSLRRRRRSGAEVHAGQQIVQHRDRERGRDTETET